MRSTWALIPARLGRVAEVDLAGRRGVAEASVVHRVAHRFSLRPRSFLILPGYIFQIDSLFTLKPMISWSLAPKTKFFRLLLAVLVVLSGAWLWLGHLDHEGQRFYAEGKGVAGVLDRFAAALRRRDLAAVEGFYSPSFRGGSLGLVNLRRTEERDGIEASRFTAEKAAGLDRAAAVDEWRAYLGGLGAIEEVGLHLHRLPAWEGDELEALVRFELIGTPQGAARPGIDRAMFRVRFERAPAGLRIREAALVDGERLTAEKPQLVNVAHAAGIDFMNRYYPPNLTLPLKFGMIRHGPGGISAADYDNDGFYDLFIPDGVASRLFHNLHDGRFADVTAAAGLAGLDGASVGVFGDYDNDGRRDLFVSRTFKPNQLFHNDGPDASGQIHFRDVTAQSGLGEDCCTTVASWADYDNDGDLDLYVGRYLDPRQAIPTTFYARNGTKSQLYRNEGGGRFTNVTVEAGVGDTGLCLGNAWGDYDDDGFPDLFVVNDFGRSTLFHNQGDGTFADVTVKAGALAYGAGMNASFADYDNDGRLDLYTTDIRSEHGWFAESPTVMRYMANSWRQGVWRTDMPLYFQIFRQSGFGFVKVFQEMASGNHLLRNKGDGTFEDVSWQTGANPLGWFWGAVFTDLDNDGRQDIYAADGWVYNDRGTEIELISSTTWWAARGVQDGQVFRSEAFRPHLVARLGAQPAVAQRFRRLREDHLSRDRHAGRERPADQQPRRRRRRLLEPRRH